MENVNNNAITNEEIVDVTKEMKERCFSKQKHYEEAIKKVTQQGKIYTVEFTDGYTAFLGKTRKARRIGEVVWLSKVATEEKANGYDLAHYIEEFKQNNIAFDGNTIPEFIDTVEQVEKAKKAEEARKAKEAKKAEEAKQETKQETK